MLIRLHHQKLCAQLSEVCLLLRQHINFSMTDWLERSNPKDKLQLERSPSMDLQVDSKMTENLLKQAVCLHATLELWGLLHSNVPKLVISCLRELCPIISQIA